ncbi:hypothetical protein J8273_5730 [Carpediemonas membranifera]|uniref:Uncharacterized protein n=1 Tax=Carpediemonas membranifera TaxID=201153 RepID=A0A8J6E127_9EUKA|nr:hypothetical protein J8273_5730 [Carpediemonas membranifera]|eukprot:KAG9392918.1 hypothetical protein J8273_5730 [Carpediemonas membranifera]
MALGYTQRPYSALAAGPVYSLSQSDSRSDLKMMVVQEAFQRLDAWIDASRAHLAAMCSSAPKSGRDVQRDAMIGLHSVISRNYADLPGDIPTLMREAFTREFGEEIPGADGNARQATAEEATSTLSTLDLHHRSAISFVNRIVAFLSQHPPLSMNVELAEGQELPAALHTLNQGTLWACLLVILNALTPEAKCLWFLCRKFFFTLNVAEKDGECLQRTWYDRCYHHRMYMGRLFMLDTRHHTTLTRARMPRALEVYSYGCTHIARTPKGLWGWGESHVGQLGFRSASYHFVDPTRHTFSACPKVAELEASLPHWEKHRMVTGVSRYEYQTFILTPAGTVIRQVISGSNRNGQLGLGHKTGMTGFVDLPFRVDQTIHSSAFNVFLSGRQLLFAGRVSHLITRSGLLRGFSSDEECLTPTPLRFSEKVQGFLRSRRHLIWVTEGQSHLCSEYFEPFVIPFKVTAFDNYGTFRDASGKWVKATRRSSVVCETPTHSDVYNVIHIDVDPWTPDAE